MTDRESLLLVVRAPNGDVREVPLDDVVVIGRDESADVRVEDKKVSRRHAAFRRIDGVPHVEDLGSSNGVRVDGVRIDSRTRVQPGVEVAVGGYLITLSPPSGSEDVTAPGAAAPLAPPPEEGERPPALLGRSSPVEGRRFPLRSGDNVIGRLEECDVTVLHRSVSRQHAKIAVGNASVELIDLDSANGVYVQGHRVTRAELFPGDQLRIGEVELGFENEGVEGAVPALEDRSHQAPARASTGLLVLGSVGLLMATVAFLAALLWQRDRPRPELPAGRGSTAARTSTGGGGSDPSGGARTPSRPGPQAERAGSASEIPPGAPWGRIQTATAPYSPRGPDGKPRDLPAVNPHFDHAAFVAAEMLAAEAAMAADDRPRAAGRARALLEVDPIHRPARQLLERIAELDAADEALARADALLKQDRLADAYALLSEVPEDLPQAPDARARAEKLREGAIADALSRARTEVKSARTWSRAHARYRLVLAFDPRHEAALEGLRAVEAKMRKRKMAFEAWRPNTPRGAATSAEAVASMYGSRSAPAVQRYVRGDADGAVGAAKRARRTASRTERERLDRFLSGVADARRRYARTRTEVANDPNQAWAMLLDLEKTERRFLPEGVRSFFVEELRADLSDAFAKQGEVMFDTHRYEVAFQRWAAGLELDARNTRVLAGLARLEQQAEDLAREARVAVKRGASRKACEQFRQITRMTRASTAIHRESRKQASIVCP
ncbi:MAG: FHA domain-containing protein [Myxococcota bacterium]